MATRDDVPHTLAQVEELWDKLISEVPQSSCDDSHKDETLLQILEVEPEASIFLKHLKKYPNLFERLEDTTVEHTVFVPVNSGWPIMGGLFPTGSLNGGWPAIDEKGSNGPQETDQSSAEPDPFIEEATLSMHISHHYLTIDDLVSMFNIATTKQCLVADRRPVLNVNADRSGYTLNGVCILKTNIKAANGILHLVATPFHLPMPMQSILDNRKDTTIAARAFQSVETSLISGRHDQALLAPSDQAIRNLGDEVREFLFEAESGREYLAAVLKYHVYPHTTVYSNLIWPKNDTSQVLKSSDSRKLLKGIARQKITSALMNHQGVAQGTELKFVRCGGLVSMFLDECAHVTVSSIAAINGSINIIDRVLLPGFDGSTELTVDKIKHLLADYI